MTIPEITGFVILGVSMGAQLWLRSFLSSRMRTLLAAAAAIVFASVVFLIFHQYSVWKMGVLTRFLLPPYQSWKYFVLYALSRFLGPWAIAAIAGVTVYFVAHRANAHFNERFFEPEEPFLFGLATFASGYPAFLVYIVAMLGIGLLLTVVYTVLEKGRAPLFYLWLPVGLFAILITHTFLASHGLVKFNL